MRKTRFAIAIAFILLVEIATKSARPGELFRLGPIVIKPES